MAWLPYAQAAAPIIGGIGGALAGGGGDKFASIKDRYSPRGRDQIFDAWERYNMLGPMEYYPGDSYAGLSDRQRSAMDAIARFGTADAPGGRRIGDFVDQGQLGLGSLGAGADFLSGLSASGAPGFEFDMDTFNQIYNNPNLPGMVEAAQRDIFRNTEWNQVPGLNQMASSTGNPYSSGRGLTEGIQRGMAQDRASDVAANIYGNAFNQAVRGGLIGGQQNIGAMLDQNRLISGGLGNLANIGLPGISNAYDASRQVGFDRMNIADLYQQNRQNQIDADMARYFYNQQAPYDFQTQRLNMALAPGGAQQTTPGMSPIYGAAQGIGAGLGLASWMGNQFATQGSATGPAAPQPAITPYNPTDYSQILSAYSPHSGADYSSFFPGFSPHSGVNYGDFMIR